MEFIDHKEIDDVEILHMLIDKYQSDVADMNTEISEVKQKCLIYEERIKRLKKLYYLRLSELIKET